MSNFRQYYMSKPIAIICMFCFLALQYGKLASYWQCRMSAESVAAYCECEKYLIDTTQKGVPENAATAIAKEKTEECYFWDLSAKKLAAQQPVTYTPSALYQGMIPEDHTKNIFQPPRV
jgi:hypothetical protein